MIRKLTFTRDDVIAAGFQVVDTEGWDQLTARSVANALGSSTAPVYSNFSNMGELAEAVALEALRIFEETISQPQTDDPILNTGLGILNFAWEHPLSYEALFRKSDHGGQEQVELMERMLDLMSHSPHLAPLSEMERLIILKKMAIFTNGVATEICDGRVPAEARRLMEVLLQEVGEAVVAEALQRDPRTLRDQAIMNPLSELCCQPCKSKKEDGNE